MDAQALYDDALVRLQQMHSMGTGAVEIKSGYGLSLDSELKILRVIRRLKETHMVPIKATFLGCHAVPDEFAGDRTGYVNHVINDMLPAIADEGLADYCDVFCESGYFNADETYRVLEAAGKYGIKGRVHAEQMSHSGGIAAGVQAGARSVDHLEYISEQDIALLKDSHTMPVLLPGAAYFLKLPYPPARTMIDKGLPVALSTDYNPGSSPSGNMNMMLTFACVNMGMTVPEAINAATINSAYAMDMLDTMGSLAIGKQARLIITVPGIEAAHIPYLFASTDWIKQVI
jgi:imidazolonepropionase